MGVNWYRSSVSSNLLDVGMQVALCFELWPKELPDRHRRYVKRGSNLIIN